LPNDKAKHPHAGREKKDADGKPNQGEVISNVQHFLNLMKQGKCHVIPISEAASPDNAGYDRLVFDRKLD